jgi:predicted enzyme related to lactoylglutathione lyase
MPEQSLPAHGSFCWNELGTKDDEAAKKFYSALFGWTFKEGDAGGMKYSEIVVGGNPCGGVYKLTPEMGNVPSHWIPYVSVDDVDATAKRVEELGGKIAMPPTDIPHVGRFSMVQDPTGAMISIITLSGDHN